MAKILIIDDENNIRTMLRLALIHVGHTVETAADGFEGLAAFDSADPKPDLVLLDQRMPGMDGLQVLGELKARQSTLRVVMITAFGTIDLARAAIAQGATDFLRKPFTLETLRGAVDAILSGTDAPKHETSKISDFDQITVNGYRLHSTAIKTGKDGAITDLFRITEPTGKATACTVTLPPYVAELVRAHADRDNLPGGEGFWDALCGEALANYLWQNAETPADSALVVDDLTSGLRQWIDGVLSVEH